MEKSRAGCDFDEAETSDLALYKYFQTGNLGVSVSKPTGFFRITKSIRKDTSTCPAAKNEVEILSLMWRATRLLH